MVSAFRPRFCQADDTGRILLARYQARHSVVALAAETILERTRLFRGRWISPLSIRRSYRHRAIVFSQSRSGGRAVRYGYGRDRISARSLGGREVFLNIVEPGDAFGEIALLDRRR